MPKGDPARSCFAPAKINLALHVTGRRADGYHLLDMLVAFADIGDRVSWRPGGDACALEVADRLNRPDPVPADTSNLAWRALALAGRLGRTSLSGTVSVEKDLPSGAGIGGGSSDAAATLRLVLGRSVAASAGVRDAALDLGADLPVCLANRPARVTGIGEHVAPVALAAPIPIVLVWPGAGLSTPSVFRARRDPFGEAIPDDAIATLAGDPLAAMSALRNDLEPAASALLPAISRAADRLSDCDGCRIARMSGSGSTVVGYFDGPAKAAAAARAIAGVEPQWWVRCGNIMN